MGRLRVQLQHRCQRDKDMPDAATIPAATVAATVTTPAVDAAVGAAAADAATDATVRAEPVRRVLRGEWPSARLVQLRRVWLMGRLQHQLQHRRQRDKDMPNDASRIAA